MSIGFAACWLALKCGAALCRVLGIPHLPPDLSPPPRPAAGMDNQIKIWGLQPYARVVAASEEWVPGGPRVFPTSHVTMPLFSSEVGLRWDAMRRCQCLRSGRMLQIGERWQERRRGAAMAGADCSWNPHGPLPSFCLPAAAALELRGLRALAGRLCAEQVGGQHAGGAVAVVAIACLSAGLACLQLQQRALMRQLAGQLPLEQLPIPVLGWPPEKACLTPFLACVRSAGSQTLPRSSTPGTAM